MSSQSEDSTPTLKRSQPVTIRDVAEAAGVTIGTVSKALNGQGKLRQETRDRIRATAEELGFRPNILAQGLLRGRTYTVGLLTTDSYGRFSLPLMSGVENVLGDAQISVFLCDTREDMQREQSYI
ncbi:MAG: LacI family DNA-binding transcriptional regulator, partial [Ktedonobacteraceae bacterium]|nr:LacI family DNA-binding transcriptional regulator [Ktedonobacteraceae bacterium]